jgi:hypothetical protein
VDKQKVIKSCIELNKKLIEKICSDDEWMFTSELSDYSIDISKIINMLEEL